MSSIFFCAVHAGQRSAVCFCVILSADSRSVWNDLQAGLRNDGALGFVRVDGMQRRMEELIQDLLRGYGLLAALLEMSKAQVSNISEIMQNIQKGPGFEHFIKMICVGPCIFSRLEMVKSGVFVWFEESFAERDREQLSSVSSYRFIHQQNHICRLWRKESNSTHTSRVRKHQRERTHRSVFVWVLWTLSITNVCFIQESRSAFWHLIEFYYSHKNKFIKNSILLTVQS